MTERGLRRGVVAASQIHLPEPVPCRRGIGPCLVRLPNRERVAVLRVGRPELAGETREPGEVYEIRGCGIFPAVTAIDCQRRLELSARRVHVPQSLRQQSEAVVIGRDAARVPDPLSQHECPPVQLLRARPIAAILHHARQRSHGVGLDSGVTDRGSESTRALQPRAGAVELLARKKARADVAGESGLAGAVVDPSGPHERAPPHPHRGGRTVAAVGGDPRAPQTVHPHLRRPSLGRPRSKTRHLTHQKRIVPRRGVRIREPLRGDRVGAPQRIRHGVSYRQRPSADLDDQRIRWNRCGQRSQRIGRG